MVEVCYNALDTYGKTPEQMQSTVKLFCMVLEGQPLERVRDAFRQWVTRNSKLPTPADIMNIIDPPKEVWKPDWAVYVGLKKRIANDGYYPLSDEREFMRACERHAMQRARNAEDGDEDERICRKFALGHMDETGLIEHYN